MADAAATAVCCARPASGSTCCRWARSCFLRHAFAEDALRPEDQEQDQDAEGKTALVRPADIGSSKSFDPANRKPADDRARNIAESADDGRGKGFQRNRQP